MYRGYVKVWRKMAESRAWSRGATTIGVAVALVLRANWRDGWFAGRMVRRGQAVIGQEAFASELGVSRSQLRRILEHLVFDGFLIATPANRYTLITICKYETYQAEEERERPTDDTGRGPAEEPAEGPTEGTPGDQQPATSKKNKKKKKVCVSRAREAGPERRIEKAMIGLDTERGGGGREWNAPTVDEAKEYALAHGKFIDAVRFVAYWEACGWERAGKRVLDWRPLVLTWRDDRDPSSEGWNASYAAARRGVEEAIRENGGALATGMASAVIARVRSELGAFYRPGDAGAYDGAWYGGKAAVDAWKAAQAAGKAREG